jgi:hypothetical protein
LAWNITVSFYYNYIQYYHDNLGFRMDIPDETNCPDC